MSFCGNKLFADIDSALCSHTFERKRGDKVSYYGPSFIAAIFIPVSPYIYHWYQFYIVHNISIFERHVLYLWNSSYDFIVFYTDHV